MVQDLRIGDAEREAAVSALGDHFAAGRLTKDEFDERSHHAWSARTTRALQPLFADLPNLAPLNRTQAAGRSKRPWRLGVPLLPIFVLLVVLAAVANLPWFVIAIFCWLWWGGVFSKMRRGSHRTSHQRTRC